MNPTLIDHAELAAKLSAGTIVLLDAQGPGWYERERLPGARRLDWTRIADSIRENAPDLAAEVAVYCSSTACTASQLVAEEMARLGYRRVRRYVGGKHDWCEHGHALVVPAAQEPTTPAREQEESGGGGNRE